MMRMAGRVAALLGMCLLIESALADDWPTYQHDSARSGVTAESLQFPLSLNWRFRRHAPARGWGEPEATQVYNYGIRRVGKVRYDDAYHVTAMGQRVYFCASAENQIYCVDAESGKILWNHYTDAAPRLAPTIWQNRVYVGADDGVVRCLDAKSGKLRWKFDARPAMDRAISHGRVHSLWPVRTGVLIQNGLACFAAGLFPAEGLWLYAVNAETGEQVWKNRFDNAGTANMSPQGYLLSDDQRLILPAGRVSPGVFDLQDGRFLYGVQNGRALTGGTYCVLTDRYLYNGTQIITAYDLQNPVADKYGRKRLGAEVYGWFNARRLVVRGDTTWLAAATELLAIPNEELPAACKQVDQVRELHWNLRNDLNAYRQAEQRLKALPEGSSQSKRYQLDMAKRRPAVEKLDAAKATLDTYLKRASRWRVEAAAHEALILAGETLLAGGDGYVLAVDAQTGEERARIEVDGTARGLAVANGRLFISTTTGTVQCLGPKPKVAVSAREIAPAAIASPYPADKQATQIQQRVARILKDSGTTAGYCLVLGRGDGRLAYELARQSDLAIYGIEADAALATKSRETLSRAHLYGTRVVIEHGDPALPEHPPYFADLVIDATSLAGKSSSISAADLLRVLKPHGGVAVLGAKRELLARQNELSAQGVRIEEYNDRIHLVRGALPGAGAWTHQYGNPANTSNSGDKLANAPFRMLWFGDPGPQGIIDRHAAAPAPLSVGGRLFVQGYDNIRAYDAYNGRELWERKIEKVGRTSMPNQSSNLVAGTDSLFTVVGDHCLRLDFRTGETRGKYVLPPRTDEAKRLWGWLAVIGNTLFGSRTESDRPFRHWPQVSGNTSEAVFAIDLSDDSLRWVYEGQGIPHTALAASADRVFLLDGNLTDSEQDQALKESKQLGIVDAAPLDRKGQPRPRELAKAVALDTNNGQVLWARPCDISDFVVYPRAGQANVILASDVVVLCGSPGGGDHYLKEFGAGKFARRSIIALAADSGKLLWSGGKNYINRPTVVGDLLYAEPWAFDLKTGQPRQRQHPVTGATEPWRLKRGAGGACGATSASEHTLFFRSDTGAWYDFAADSGITRRGGQRLSCWINSITAGGLLLIPEGSADCDCPYAIQCTTVLYPDPGRTAWGRFQFDGPLVPVKHLAINVGAPGDSRDKDVLWLSCPNQVHRYNWARCRFAETPGSGYFHLESGPRQIPGTDNPHRFIHGARGVVEFSVPLTEKGKSARYTIALGFLEPDQVKAGQRTFHISLQGKQVLENLDVVQAAGGPLRAIEKTFTGVEVAGSLKVELTPAADAEKLPVLSSVEIIRE